MNRFAALLLALLLLTGCEEEQVLYVTKSKPVDPVPAVPSVQGLAPGQPLGSAPAAADTPEGLSEPEAKPFVAQDPGVPLRDVPIAGIIVKLPESFGESTGSSPMRAAQFRVAGPDGAEGEMVAFHFGAGQGGDAASNVARWLSQFTPPDGRDTAVVRYQQAPVNGLAVTRLIAEGTWTPSQMPGGAAPKGPQADYAMDALIVEGGPKGSVFFRFTGPQGLVRAQEKALENMAATVRPDGAAPTAEPGHEGHNHGPGEHGATVKVIPPGPGEVDVHGVKLKMPEGWTTVEPSSQMRAMQAEVPGGAELVAFFFGPGAGTPEANIDRWIGQVAQADGSDSHATAKTEKRTQGSFTLHTVEVFGTYSASSMGMGSAVGPKENWGLVGAVIEGGPEGTLYLRLTGPRAAIEAQRDAMKAMLDSVR